MAKVTIKDIAKECNVSITAVSFVLNGKASNVSKETADKILDTCNRLNYHPNSFASALKRKSSKTIGILVPDIDNNYYTRIIKEFEQSLAKIDYSIYISSSGYDFINFKNKIFEAISHMIDSLIIIPPSNFSQNYQKELEEIRKEIDIKIVILDRKLELGDCSLVVNDNEKGGYLASEYLIKKGHRRIACISGPEAVSSSQERLAGYERALKENGIKFEKELVFAGDYQFDSALIPAEKILKDKTITAIFAFNDQMAYAVYKKANEMNLVVGKDISVIGVDDNQFSSLISPGLTSIKQNIELQCKRVLELMFDDTKTKQTVIIEPVLIERGSVADVTN